MSSTKLTSSGWIGQTSGKWLSSKNTVIDEFEGITLLESEDVVIDSKHLTLRGYTNKPGSGQPIRLAGDLKWNGMGSYSKCSIYGYSSRTSEAVALSGRVVLTGGEVQVIGDAIQDTAVRVSGLLKTGDEDDVIIGRGRIGRDDNVRDENILTFGVLNEGVIKMGAGNDVVDALIGGYGGGGLFGNGLIDFGKGRNTMKGFGDQTVDGGGNPASKILFNPGVYRILELIQINPNDYPLGVFSITLNNDPFSVIKEREMIVADFGLIGGAGRPDDLLKLQPGTLTISEDGLATYG